MKTVQTQIFDANDFLVRSAEVQVDADNIGPVVVMFKGQEYCFTGKDGTHAVSGVATREMEAENHSRIWISLDATAIFED